MPIRVMIVDDSAVIRGLFNKALSQDPQVQVVASASNGKIALMQLKEADPDIVLLDIEMPEMDGITALPELIKLKPDLQVVMVSSLTLRNASISLRALELGAMDYIPKPTSNDVGSLQAFYRELLEKVREFGGRAMKKRPTSSPAAAQPAARASGAPSAAATATTATRVAGPAVAPVLINAPIGKVTAIAIASSTGGPQALMTVFSGIKGSLSHLPIFVTQHMPPSFTTILADHLSKAGGRAVVEGSEGAIAAAGAAYIAPGDFHMVMRKEGMQTKIHINKDPQENFCRPAADPMLRSLTSIYGAGLLVLVLTGMGQDGLEGSKSVVHTGGSVIAQNEASCVVYGMPKAVVEHKLCKAVLPLAEIPAFLIKVCT